jgi:hypothetical protein
MGLPEDGENKKDHEQSVVVHVVKAKLFTGSRNVRFAASNPPRSYVLAAKLALYTKHFPRKKYSDIRVFYS